MEPDRDSTSVFDPGLACLGLLARFHQVPVNLDGLRHRFGDSDKPFEALEILRALKAIGLKAREVRPSRDRLEKVALPAIAGLKQGGFCILAQVERTRVLVMSPISRRSRTVSLETFAEDWSGSLILATRRAPAINGNGRFGISWFVSAALKYKRLFMDVLAASFFLQLFALITPLFFQVVIDKVLVHKGLTTLDVLAVGMLLVFLFEVILGGLRTFLFSHTTNRIDVELGARLYAHLTALPLAYFGNRRVGDSVARVRELENVRNFITGSALTIAIDIPFTAVFFVVLYYYSPILTMVVAGAIPFYILLSVLVIPILRRRLEEKFNRGAENQAFLVESITGIETVKTLAVEPQMMRRWEEQLAGYVRSAFRVSNLGNISGQIAAFINKVTTLLILWVGAHAVIDGHLSVGQLVAFNMIAGRVSTPVLRLVQLWQDYQQTGVSIARLGDILNVPTEPSHTPSHSTPERIKGKLKLENIVFRYRPDGPEILTDINLYINPGEMIGIAGRSGSGKSTLAKLVQRLYLPERGRIDMDGMDLAQMDPSWLRRQVGVVLQENHLFNRTVRENIALANPGLPMTAVEKAARLAGCHDFILELPHGYDSRVEEHGGNLSGGQRQRIAIARALVTNPRVLIFDEATSALDYESERIIQENMAAMRLGRTVLIIAHRLSAIRHCDRIIVLDQGRITEQGSYQELLKNNGWFASLHTHQTVGKNG